MGANKLKFREQICAMSASNFKSCAIMCIMCANMLKICANMRNMRAQQNAQILSKTHHSPDPGRPSWAAGTGSLCLAHRRWAPQVAPFSLGGLAGHIVQAWYGG